MHYKWDTPYSHPCILHRYRGAQLIPPSKGKTDFHNMREIQEAEGTDHGTWVSLMGGAFQGTRPGLRVSDKTTLVR